MIVFVVRLHRDARRAHRTRANSPASSRRSERNTSRLDTHEGAIVDVLQRVMAPFEPPPPTPNCRTGRWAFTPACR